MTVLTRSEAGLPPLLMTSDPGSFARYTIAERKPKILRQVVENQDYPEQVRQAANALHEEIASLPMQPVSENAPSADFWNRALSEYSGKSWLQVPWYFAETFFYRRLLEAVDYFRPGPWEGHDPFGKQKRAQDAIAVQQLAETWGQLVDIDTAMAFELLLHSCLWGNRADLSYREVLAQARGGLVSGQERQHLLINHTEIAHSLLSSGLLRVAFISDNAGMELLCDLALSDFLIARGWVQEVVFHLKDQPFFVSDAMPQDVHALVASLQGADDQAMQELGIRLHEHLDTRRLVLKDGSPSTCFGQRFWTSCHMFRDMPPQLRSELLGADLVILKGDANYRRLLGDRHWPHTTRLEDIASYFPAPFLTLRTLKAELMVGLQPGQAETLHSEDPEWLINGKRGIVQFVAGREA